MRKVVSCLVLFFLTFLISCQSAKATFTKNSLNPVLEVDTQPLQPLSMPVPSIVQTDSDYKMWFTEYSGLKHQIGFATSLDGINWTKYSSNPVLSPKVNDPWEKEIGEPSVIYINDSYTMWFASLNFTQKESFRISRTTSLDGISWTPHQIIFTKSSAVWESEGVNRPSVLLINGEYKMWYGARDSSGIWRIGYATSLNGIDWNRHPDPVLQPSLSWESTVVASANVIFLDGIYHMYYHAGPVFLHYIGHATSTDGINWTKDPSPILERGSSLADFDRNMIAAPSVVRVANKLRLYYAGHDGANWRIGFAEETLPVSYFSQKDPLWKDDQYDSKPKTMEALGCAVTSAAMVLKYFNVQKTPGNSLTGLPPKELTPGTLNEWLKDVKDGSFRNGVTNFASIATMTTKAHELDSTSPKLDYSQGFTVSDIDEELSSDRKPILKLFYLPSDSDMHFVVATGSANSTYSILDPAFTDRTELSPHYPTVLRVDKFQVTNSDFSYLIFAVDEAVDIKLLNSNNEPVGQIQFEAPIFDQVTQTSGEETLKVLYFKQPPEGNYTLKISSTNNQTYQLDAYIYNQEGDKALQTIEGIVGPTDTDILRLDFDPVSEMPTPLVQEIKFESVRADINSSYQLGWINHESLYNYLNKNLNRAEDLYNQNSITKAKKPFRI